jgi:acyl-CoA thioesterase
LRESLENNRQNRPKSKFAQDLGIKVKEASPGFAVLEMEIGEGLLNNFETAHGGAIFTLADTAFGLAGNTRGAAVAMQANIHFFKPALLGDTLTATATEENLTRSTGVYEVRIKNQKGDSIALFSGTIYRLKGGGKGLPK